MKVCYPGNVNRYAETISLCGEQIPKQPIHEYTRRLKQDSSRVTSAIHKVTCLACLYIRRNQLDNLSDDIKKQIEVLKGGSPIQKDEEVFRV